MIFYFVIQLSGGSYEKYVGLYKIKGRWYNIIDVLLSIASETKKSCCAWVFSEKYVTENIRKLLHYNNEGGMFKLYTYPKGDDMIKYPYDGLFLLCYELEEHKIIFIYNEEKHRTHIIFKNVKDGKFDSIGFFSYGGRPKEIEASEIGVKTLEDLKQFKTLKEFHNFLLEVIE